MPRKSTVEQRVKFAMLYKSVYCRKCCFRKIFRTRKVSSTRERVDDLTFLANSLHSPFHKRYLRLPSSESASSFFPLPPLLVAISFYRLPDMPGTRCNSPPFFSPSSRTSSQWLCGYVFIFSSVHRFASVMYQDSFPISIDTSVTRLPLSFYPDVSRYIFLSRSFSPF